MTFVDTTYCCTQLHLILLPLFNRPSFQQGHEHSGKQPQQAPFPAQQLRQQPLLVIIDGWINPCSITLLNGYSEVFSSIIYFIF